MFTEFIKNISYTCVLDAVDHTDVFAFIAVNKRLGSIICHIFHVPKVRPTTAHGMKRGWAASPSPRMHPLPVPPPPPPVLLVQLPRQGSGNKAYAAINTAFQLLAADEK
jgi:hypothetical protein